MPGTASGHSTEAADKTGFFAGEALGYSNRQRGRSNALTDMDSFMLRQSARVAWPQKNSRGTRKRLNIELAFGGDRRVKPETAAGRPADAERRTGTGNASKSRPQRKEVKC